MTDADRLTTTSYALLGHLSMRPWTTYELAKQMSWDAVARDYVLPGIQRASRAQRLKQIA